MVLDWLFDWAEIWEDVAERPYVTVGFAGFVALVPLAVDVDARVDPPARRAALAQLHRLVYSRGGAGGASTSSGS